MLRDFKRPDLKAPRYRPSCLQLLNKRFFDQVRANTTTASLSDSDILRIIDTAHDLVQSQVIATRDGVELPEQLGYLFIGATPATKKGNIDYKRSMELGKEVHHQNWDTDGLTGKLFYTNYETKYRFKYHSLWKFTPVRQFKKAVSQAFREAYSRYVRVDNWSIVSRIFRRHQSADYAAKKRQQQLQQVKTTAYDAFAL